MAEKNNVRRTKLSTTDLTPALISLCRNVDLAILDCSFASSQPGGAHMHAEECGKVAREAGVKRLVLSHFYQAADRSNVVTQARRFFSGPIIKAKDLLTLQVGTGLPANVEKRSKSGR